MRVHYPAEVSRDPDTDYGVSFPDFPGCVTTGPDIAAALRNAEEALGGHIDAMLADGEPIPEPTPPEAVCSPAADNVIAVAMVPVRRHGRAVRINISIDERLLRQIDAAAEAEGLTRSRWLAVTAGKRLADADA